MKKQTNSQPDTLTEPGLVREAKAFHMKKRLGQHFLVSPDALQTIADAIEAGAGDTIIEVGSGIGFLTRLLCLTGAHIIAVDLDRESIEHLTAQNLPNLEILHGDFLRFDLTRLRFFQNKKQQQSDNNEQGSTSSAQRLKVIGNVPYQITGPIVGHILGEIDKPSPWLSQIDNVVLTVQYEVAKRFVAKAGEDDYSKISLLTHYYCEPELVERVPAAAFYPAPKVNSAVVRLRPRHKPAVDCRNPALMKKLIEAGFRQRRKMFRNSISFLKLEPAVVERVFRDLSLDPQARAERLSLQQFAMLADAFDECSDGQ